MACAVAGISSCRRHRIYTGEGSKTPVIPAQNKSVKWLLWNVTFQRLETMPLETKSKKKTKEKSSKAQEQLGEVL